MTTLKVRRNTLSNRLSVALKDDLTSRFRLGERLPSERQLAAAHSVSPVTISRVMQQLQDDGVVYRIPNSGTYLCENANASDGVPGRVAPDSVVALSPSDLTSVEPKVAVRVGILAGLKCQLPDASTGIYGSGHELMSAVECEIQRGGGTTMIVDPGQYVSHRFADHIVGLYESGVNGLVVLSDSVSALTMGELMKLQDRMPGLPIVNVYSSHDPGLFDAVGVDWALGIWRCVLHLTGMGHTRIAFACPQSSPSRLSWVQPRIEVFRNSLLSLGIEVDNNDIFVSGEDYDDDPTSPGYACGRDAGRRILDTGKYTAIMGANDYTAIGVMDAVLETGLQVPGHVSVIGFDNAPMSGVRGLSTVNCPTVSVGIEAARRVTERLQRPRKAVRSNTLVAPDLVVRRSTGAVQTRTKR